MTSDRGNASEGTEAALSSPEPPKTSTTTGGLNPNANVFQIKKPTTVAAADGGSSPPPASTDGEGEQEQAGSSPPPETAPSPPQDEFSYMNGDSGGKGVTFPPTPESPAALSPLTYNVATPNGGPLDGQVLFPTPESPPQPQPAGAAAAEEVSPLEGTIPDEHLRAMLKNQLEYYFSRENLANDSYLVSQMDADRFVSISTVAGFRQVKRLTNCIELVVDVLRESSNVQVDDVGEKVRPLHKRCIVILREIPESTPVEDVKNLFRGETCPKFASCEFAHNDSWYVTFETEEQAQGAYQFLREEVRTFLGRPIMARIKAKPLVRNSFGSKNGFKGNYDPNQVYSTNSVASGAAVGAQAAKLPSPAAAAAAVVAAPPTVVSMPAVSAVVAPAVAAPASTAFVGPVASPIQSLSYHVGPSVSQVRGAGELWNGVVNLPFFPPNTAIPIWPSPMPYFDPGTAFAANGYTPTATYKLSNTSSNKHSYIRNPSRHERSSKASRYQQQQQQQQSGGSQQPVAVSNHQQSGHHHHHHHQPHHHHHHNRDHYHHHDHHHHHHQARYHDYQPSAMPSRRSQRGSQNGGGGGGGGGAISEVSAYPRGEASRGRGGESGARENKSTVSVSTAAVSVGGPHAVPRESSDVSRLADQPQPPRAAGRGPFRNRRRRQIEEDGAKRGVTNGTQQPAKDAPNPLNGKSPNESFEWEANSFPPLPGATSNSSSGEVFESKMSDVVKGKAKPLTREPKPGSVSSEPAATSSPSPAPTPSASSTSPAGSSSASAAVSTTSSTATATSSAAPTPAAAAPAAAAAPPAAAPAAATAPAPAAAASSEEKPTPSLPTPPPSPHKVVNASSPAESTSQSSNQAEKSDSPPKPAKEASQSKPAPPPAQTQKQEDSSISSGGGSSSKSEAPAPSTPAGSGASQPPKMSYALIVAKAKAKKDTPSSGEDSKKGAEDGNRSDSGDSLPDTFSSKEAKPEPRPAANGPRPRYAAAAAAAAGPKPVRNGPTSAAVSIKSASRPAPPAAPAAVASHK